MIRALVSTLALGVTALSLSLLGAGVRGDQDESESSVEVRRGLAIAPLPLNLKGKDRDVVGLGSYIVNAIADCNDCHSVSEYAPGGDPFKGEPKQVDTEAYLRGGRQFGPIVSRNLRPEIGTNLPAGLTLAKFLDVMRHGTDLDMAHPQISPLLQVMPWPSFQDMSQSDIVAIYEYLRALPPVPPGG